MTDHAALVAELRALIETVRTTDLAEAEAAGVDLEAMAAALATHRRALAPHVVDDIRMQAGLRAADRPGADAGHLPELAGSDPQSFFPYSPVIGRLNPLAPPFRFWVEDDGLRGVGRFGSAYNGPPAGTHGGMVAALMDELLGVTGVVTGNHGFTGTLSIRYDALTPLHTDLDARGWVESTDGRKSFIAGELWAGDTRCVRADGVFIRPAD